MLYPLNKYLVVEPVEETQKEESTILIPDDFEVDASPYKLVNLLQVHVDSRLKPGMKLLTPSHMIEQVSFYDETRYIVPEHCVVGFYGADE
tara:strand:- start:754 stop:1026 length:273 start_codon:yes stop_codon:yes gene_type:complete